MEKPSSPDIIVLDDRSGEMVLRRSQPTKDEQDCRGAERNMDGVMDGMDRQFGTPGMGECREDRPRGQPGVEFVGVRRRGIVNPSQG